MRKCVPLIAALFALRAFAAGEVPEGRKVVEASKCERCHQDKVYGAEGTIYLRKDRKVTSPQKLAAQISACNSQLNLGLFPEDEEHVVAFLEATYYRFSAK